MQAQSERMTTRQERRAQRCGALELRQRGQRIAEKLQRHAELEGGGVIARVESGGAFERGARLVEAAEHAQRQSRDEMAARFGRRGRHDPICGGERARGVPRLEFAQCLRHHPGIVHGSGGIVASRLVVLRAAERK